MESIDLANVVYVDEVGIDNDIVPLYGWSEIGEKTYAEKLAFKTNRLSIVAAYRHGEKEMFAPFEYKGYTDQHLFSYWFEHMLCPQLKPKDCVILDNASVHNKEALHDIAVDHNIKILFLPAYSPDLNPIEHCWANFKKALRKLIKKAKNFQDAITEAFNKTFSC